MPLSLKCFLEAGRDELKFVAAALSEAPKQHGIFELTFNPVTFEDETNLTLCFCQIGEAMNRFIDRNTSCSPPRGCKTDLDLY